MSGASLPGDPKFAAPRAADPERVTTALSNRQVQQLEQANEFARHLGLQVCFLVTIAWAMTEAGDDHDGHLFEMVREGLSKVFRRRGVPFRALWVRERGMGGRATAEHAHLCIFVSATDKLSVKQLSEACSRLVQRHGGAGHPNSVHVQAHRNGDIRYLLKGSSPETQARLKIKQEWRVPQGEIRGKRSGVTECLGPAARRLHRPATGALVANQSPDHPSPYKLR
jgi:hypothetical protein